MTERAAEIEALLADPARRRELAETIAGLESRVVQLEDELKRVDLRLTKARLDRWDIP